MLPRVAEGDHAAFGELSDRIRSQGCGLIRKVLRDPAQSEEVAREVLLEVWRTSQRCDPSKSNATTWTLTMAHCRAVDRVRAAQALGDGTERMAAHEGGRDVDEVVEEVEARVESQQVRRALTGLSDLQRQAIALAYSGGYSYPEVAQTLGAPLGTVTTRLRDELIRWRATMAVAS